MPRCHSLVIGKHYGSIDRNSSFSANFLSFWFFYLMEKNIFTRCSQNYVWNSSCTFPTQETPKDTGETSVDVVNVSQTRWSVKYNEIPHWLIIPTLPQIIFRLYRYASVWSTLFLIMMIFLLLFFVFIAYVLYLLVNFFSRLI